MRLTTGAVTAIFTKQVLKRLTSRMKRLLMAVTGFGCALTLGVVLALVGVGVAIWRLTPHLATVFNGPPSSKEAALKRITWVRQSEVERVHRIRLLQTGQAAPAEVVRVENTRSTVDSNLQVRLYLRVSPSDDSSFGAVTTLLVPRSNLPCVGDRVPVRFDPHNRSDLAVE